MGLREEKKTEQRRAILATAIALFRKRGYEQTRVQDIVARLRISEATFFNYFPTKEALMQEFALEQLDFSIATVKAELERHDSSVPDRIRNVMLEWARSWDADPEFYTLVATRSRMMSDPQGPLREKSLRLYDWYEELFSEGQRRGEIRSDQQALHLAEMLEGMVIKIAENWISGWWKDRTEPLEERFINALNVFLDGCAPARRGVSRSPRAKSAMKSRRIKRPARKF
ncbi:MAG TPA: TetR/AcrR family transcriptional regulator [Candidatus Binataceae bacterium]|nr:TetR/AcrR family transcriptional regulator [Candidatus Binataceae bacterium]